MKLSLFICFILAFIASCSSEITTSRTIKWLCSQTPHHKTCDYYIGQHNTTTTPKSMIEFLETSVQVAIDHAGEVLKRVKVIEAKYPNVPGKRLWSSCVDYFGQVIFTLNKILDKDHTRHPTPLDVQTWLSAGLAYIDLCGTGFELINMNNAILATISTNLTELINNSLAISVLIRGVKTKVPDWDFRNEYKLRDFAFDQTPNVVVAQDGSGNFTTVQEGVDSAVNVEYERYVIYVKAGIYNEHVAINNTLPNITMFGDGINQTIITGNKSEGEMMDTPLAGDLRDTVTFEVWGSGFIARDITFRNTAGPFNGRAVAVLSVSDKSAFYHCSIEGYQDSLWVYLYKQFYKECQIFGTVDFIFGNALAVFQDCDIFLRKPRPGGGLVVSAPGRLSEHQPAGFSFQGCKITAAEDLSGCRKAFLGRPLTPYTRTIFMESFLDGWIDPQGWLDYSGNNLTAFCAEYNNDGPGSSTGERVKWPDYHVITSPEGACAYTVAKFVSGEEWLPYTPVPFVPGLETSSTECV